MISRRTSTRRCLAAAVGATIVLSACTSNTDTAVPVPGEPTGAETGDTPSDDDPAADATAGSPDTTSLGPTTDPTTTTEAPTTDSDTTTSTTTSTVPGLDVYAPDCVAEVQPGDSLGLITDSYDDDTITIATVRAENGIEGDTIFPGQLLDICVDNGLDDITGSERARNAAIVETETVAAIEAQQAKLNELFDGYGIRELLVDGVSGPVTRQRLCAVRLGLGLPATLANMEPGSDEETMLMEAESISVPFTTAALSERWILIDRTCQVMFAGHGATQLDFVFPTSTGEAGFETRDQDRSRAFRYDPALDNEGWHDSTDYPVPIDNPLSGNMYRPLYFDGGQAIHGANNVPTTPQSKGCARLRPSDQDALVAWLGLADATGPTGSADRINVTVNVQGAYPYDG